VRKQFFVTPLRALCRSLVMCRHVSGLKDVILLEPRSGAVWKKYEVIKETEMRSEERNIFKIKGRNQKERQQNKKMGMRFVMPVPACNMHLFRFITQYVLSLLLCRNVLWYA